MSLQIIQCEQNSPEWFRARKGIATASAFADVLAKGEGKTRRSYLLRLAGEILTGLPAETFVSKDMERGHTLEPEARDLYAFQTGAQLERVGFVRNERVGCSPDSLIGADGGLEIKTAAPHLLIDMILKDEFPAAHKAQVQGTLWVTGRKWWDVAVYWPGLPLFVKRAERDEAYITNLASAVETFNAELDGVVSEMNRRIHESLPDWVALRDLTPSPALLASRIVQKELASPIDTETLAPNGMPAFLVRDAAKLAPAAFNEPTFFEEVKRSLEDCIDLVSLGTVQQKIVNPAKPKLSPSGWEQICRIVLNHIDRLSKKEVPGASFAAAAE